MWTFPTHIFLREEISSQVITLFLCAKDDRPGNENLFKTLGLEKWIMKMQIICAFTAEKRRRLTDKVTE